MTGSGGGVSFALDVTLQLSDFWAIEQHNWVWSWANLSALDNERKLLCAVLSSYTIWSPACHICNVAEIQSAYSNPCPTSLGTCWTHLEAEQWHKNIHTFCQRLHYMFSYLGFLSYKNTEVWAIESKPNSLIYFIQLFFVIWLDFL